MPILLGILGCFLAFACGARPEDRALFGEAAGKRSTASAGAESAGGSDREVSSGGSAPPVTGGASVIDASPGGASGTDPAPGGASGTDPAPGGVTGIDASPGGASGTDPASGGATGTDASPGGASGTDPGPAPGGASVTDAAPGGTDAALGGASVTDATASGGAMTAGLVHRYSFGGSGTTATDSIGAADGTVVNATLMGGDVTLSGETSDQYVELPSTLISGLTSATFEVWVTWNGGSAWQRIFDFGDNDGPGPGNQGTSGTSYLFLTPNAANRSGPLRVLYSFSGPDDEKTLVDAEVAVPVSTMTHIAVVVDDAAETLELYLDGASAGRATMTGTLADLHVENSWLGRSQFSADPEFAGTIHEFRIYAAARTAAQIQASRSAGPDALPTD
jgi:hypothetical protein